MRAALDTRTAATTALERARGHYRAADWPAAFVAAEAARIGAERAGDIETEGRGWHIRSEALRQLGRYDEIGDGFERSIALLTEADAPVWLACAENDYGWLLYGRGAREDALQLFETALDRLEGEGDTGRALTVRESLLWPVYDDGNYADVIAKTDEHAGLGADEPEPLPYIARIRTLSFLAVADDHGAITAAEGYEAIAAIGSGWDRAAAPLLLARARVAAGDIAALDRFPALVGATEPLTRAMQAIARAWWWAALAIARPREACARRVELYAPVARSLDAVAGIEARAVERCIHPTLPVRLDPPPALSDPLDDLEAALYLAAYRQTEGNASRMAARLGRDRTVVSRRMRELGLDPLPHGRHHR